MKISIKKLQKIIKEEIENALKEEEEISDNFLSKEEAIKYILKKNVDISADKAEKLVNGEKVLGVTYDTRNRDEYGQMKAVPDGLPEEAFKRNKKGEVVLVSKKVLRGWLGY